MNQDKIGKFLASLRKENNLTQEDIAEKLNVNVKSVSRWENGRNLPDPSIMKEICKIYNPYFCIAKEKNNLLPFR